MYEEINKSDKAVGLALIGVVVWILGTLITVVGTYFKSIADARYSIVYFNYYAPSVLFAALGVYVFFVVLFKRDSGFNSKKISYLGQQTFGIYMCHMIPLQILGEVISRTGGLSPWVWYPLIVALTTVASLVIVAVIQRIPVIRHICP